MANLQYIGARYVPKIFEQNGSSEWVSGIGYENLIVVTYLGDSYTSKKPVPSDIGNPADNPEYWVKTANYNAQIANYEAKVDVMKDNKYLYVEDFGAVGDGATDDTDAFLAAVAVADVSGQTVSGRSRSYYLRPNEITMRCSLDLNGAVIKPAAYSNNSFIFQVKETYDESLNLSYTQITKKSISNSQLFGKGFTLVSPLSMGLRNGSGEEYFYTQYVKCDELGNIINKNLPIEIVNGTWTALNICKLNLKELKIANIGLNLDDVSDSRYIPILVKSMRPNVVIENITLYGTFTATESTSEIIEVLRACNNTINNVSGSNPVSANYSGYIVHIYESDDCKVTNIDGYDRLAGSWPAFAQTAANNIVYENCCAKRIDCHNLGTYTARNCSFVYANYSGGYGTILLENCTFVGSNSVRVTNRTDYTLPFTGSIIVRGCVESNDTDSIKFFNFSNDRAQTDITSDFNDGSTEVIIENCTILNTAATVVSQNAKYSKTRDSVHCTIKNCSLDVLTLINSYRDGSTAPNGYPSPKFNIEGNRIKTQAQGVIDGSVFGTLSIVNNFFDEVLKITTAGGNQGGVIVGNVMEGMETKLNQAVVTGNIVTTDVAPVIDASVSRLIMTNNIMATSGYTVSNIGAWNKHNGFET